MDCSICKRKIKSTFLDKPIGTFIKDSNGKKVGICFECQKNFPDKTLMLQQIK